MIIPSGVNFPKVFINCLEFRVVFMHSAAFTETRLTACSWDFLLQFCI